MRPTLRLGGMPTRTIPAALITALITALVATLALMTAAAPAAGASGRATASEPAGPGPGPDAECTTSDLKITFVNNQDAAGTAYDDLDFTNRSASNCFAEGWPGVSYVVAGGEMQVGAAARWAPGRRIRVTLRPGASAHAALTFGDNASSTPRYCGPSVPASRLRIYPPDQYQATVVNLGFSIPACARSQFWIGPISRGAAAAVR